MADSNVSVTHLGGDRWVITVIGEHDISNVAHLQTALNGVFDTGTSIVLDLSDATFIDSSVIHTLLAAHHRAEETPGEQLAIVAPEHSFAGRVIEFTGLQPLLPIYPTKPAALRAIGAG